MTEELRLKAVFKRTVLENPFIPTLIPTDDKDGRPSRRQTRFLAYDGLEAFYGGAAGGGKSDALLMAAVQYAEVPGYAALILRRTMKMLNQEDGLIPRSKAWFQGKGCKYHETDKRWTFPSGATLTFGYLDHERHLDCYIGGAWQFVAFDEASHFPEARYRFLFSRLRKLVATSIPIRMRAASNPGGPGHDWLKRRFITGDNPKFFVPAKLADNPGLAAQEYIRALINLDPIRRAQLLAGDWDAYEGGRFKEKWFRSFHLAQDLGGAWRYYFDDDEQDGIHCHACWTCVVCDPACTEHDFDEGGDADPTAICVFAITPNHDILILHIVRAWLDIDDIPKQIGRMVEALALPTHKGGPVLGAPSWVGIEDNGFAIGITRACQKMGLTVKSLSPEGKGKLVRNTPAIIRAEAGQIFLPERGSDAWTGKEKWCEEFISECIQYTGDPKMDAHEDMIDCLGYCVQQIERFGLGGPLVVQPQEDLEEDEEDMFAGGLVGWQR